MKTRQSFLISPSSFFRVIILSTFFSILFLSCGDDSDESVNANASTVAFNELNTCDIGSGLPATSFDFVINYEATENIEITKILFNLEWSNGDTESSETTDFNDLGSRIEYDWCYRFGSDEWVEITHRLETKNEITSNTTTIRVDKPDGAN